MAFDAKTLLQGGGNIGSITSSFGVPSCMLGLASDVLGLIPTPILLAMRQAMMAGRIIADAIIKKINSFIRDLLGISLFPDRDGFFGFFSDYSRMGLDLISGIPALIGTFIGFAQGIASAANELSNRFAAAKDCLEKYKEFLDYQNGNAADRREELAALDPAGYDDLVNSQFGVYFQQAQQAQTFIDEVDAAVARIDAIILARTLDPSLEPGEIPQQPTESVFRLEAGPPRSKSGKFVMSVDGLYYDSQTDGIEPALIELADRDKDLRTTSDGGYNGDLWRLEFDPSLGGRGVPTTVSDLKYYFNSVLDPDIIDDSVNITKYYDEDELLLTLEGQKDRKIYDVSSDLQELIDSGSSIAVIDNMRQVLISETSHFQDKINKRKKQIELAVKVPTFLGRGPKFLPGQVPVNDFSYLAGSNFLLDVENQRKIVLDQADVTGVVLPLEVKFTEKIETTEPVVLEHILLANVAKGETIDDAPVSSAPSLQVNTRIIEDGLFALYNYLTAESSDPSSTNFDLRNSSKIQKPHNGQLVGETRYVFDKGLGIAKLDGICNLDTTNNSVVSSVGSYIKLPEKSNFQDILYNTEGATFETWVHTPNLNDVESGYTVGDSSTSSLYRLILANENTGNNPKKGPQEDLQNLDKDVGSTIVRGIIYGFTRDRRFTTNDEPSNSAADNPTTNLQLVLAPTQSHNSSSVGFIANRGGDCDRDSWRAFKVPVNQEIVGKSLSSCEEEFCQLSLVLHPIKDEIKLYFDGINVATSSYQEVFGTARVGEVFKAPSVFQPNSFEYASSIINSNSVDAIKYGPTLDEYFTPWILGGGYTDGNPNGNFMGGTYGGKISGLRGYLGCTRFYSKPLTDEEVLNNYEATSKFFKNIDLG